LTRSKYKYLGVVYRKTDHSTRKGACKMQAAWVLEATAVMQQSADKVRLLMVQTFIYSAVMYGGGETRRRSGQDVSGRKALRSILALHPQRLLF
jgi:hypothetical protein